MFDFAIELLLMLLKRVIYHYAGRQLPVEEKDAGLLQTATKAARRARPPRSKRRRRSAGVLGGLLRLAVIGVGVYVGWLIIQRRFAAGRELEAGPSA